MHNSQGFFFFFFVNSCCKCIAFYGKGKKKTCTFLSCLCLNPCPYFFFFHTVILPYISQPNACESEGLTALSCDSRGSSVFLPKPPQASLLASLRLGLSKTLGELRRWVLIPAGVQLLCAGNVRAW